MLQGEDYEYRFFAHALVHAGPVQAAPQINAITPVEAGWEPLWHTVTAPMEGTFLVTVLARRPKS
jgi:hypothetical protein